MMRRILTMLVAPAALAMQLVAAPAMAQQGDTLEIPEAPGAAMALPKRGSTMQRVEEQFGAPVRIIDAVGDPPITRWVYEDFTVYFEFDRVIHPVRRSSHTGHGVTATVTP